MLIEIKTYFSDGSISHDLVNCDKPNDWDNKKHIIGNYERMCSFYANAFGNCKIVKIEKKCVLACKTKTKFKHQTWCSGEGYVWPAEWWKM